MRIGDLELGSNLLLAPMAGYCDLSFRLVVRGIGGVGLASTDLLSPHGVLRRTEHSMYLAATCPEDRPLCMQLYGCDGSMMADAARRVQDHGAAVIDINMGCPADKIVKRDGGVALMGTPKLAVRIADQIVRAVRVPVTVKMRLGCGQGSCNAAPLARMLEDVGVQAVTVHGRTGSQRFSRSVDLDGIAAVVQAISHIPVIGNGDIRSPQDAKTMLDRTGCAGVMIGRRALGDLWIFRDTQAYLTTGEIPPSPTVGQRVAAMVEHFNHLARLRSPRTAVVEFRQRVSCYARTLPRSKQLRQRMNRIASPQEFHDAVGEYLDQAQCGTGFP